MCCYVIPKQAQSVYRWIYLIIYIALKNESWRNVPPLIDSKAKFALMSDHPVILQRNLFYTLRHLLLFGLSKSDCISKIIKKPAEIIGIDSIGQIKLGFISSMII